MPITKTISKKDRKARASIFNTWRKTRNLSYQDIASAICAKFGANKIFYATVTSWGSSRGVSPEGEHREMLAFIFPDCPLVETIPRPG